MRWGVIANKRIRTFYYKTAASLHSTACFAVCKAVIASINLLVKLIATAQSIHTMAKEKIVINGGGSLSNCKASGIEDATGIESVAIHVGIHPTTTLLYDVGSPQSLTSIKLMQISQMPA
jgi:hypothetical protein